MPAEYKIFDIHTHAYPDIIAALAVHNVTQNDGVSAYHDGTVHGLSEYEKKRRGRRNRSWP